MKTALLILLMGSALWLSTGLVRTAAIPGLSQLEKQLWADIENLKAENPELNNLGKVEVFASEAGGISTVWAKEICVPCMAKEGAPFGAELLLIESDSEEGPAAMVQVYIYNLKSGDFVKELARLYPL